MQIEVLLLLLYAVGANNISSRRLDPSVLPFPEMFKLDAEIPKVPSTNMSRVDSFASLLPAQRDTRLYV